jgi:hypothetical protein
VPSVTISGGKGSVAITGAASLTAAAFGNTGTTTFNSTAGFSTAAATFAGPVVFKDNVTLTTIGVTFGGDAFFADEKKITLTAATSIITLKPGSELAHGAPATGVPTAYSAIIANFDEADVTLTPSAGTVLTFGASGEKSITQSGTGGHGIKITGNATLVPDATYTVKSESSNVGTLTVAASSELVIGAGLLTPTPEGFGSGADNDDDTSSKLVLTGASEANGALLKGAGSVVAGGTTIVGADDGWQAVADSGTPTVTIAEDSIAGSAAVTLTAQHANSAITVAKATLAVDGVAITLASSKGTVTLTGSADTPSNIGKLLLKGGTNPGSLAVDSDNSTDVTIGEGATATNFLLTAGTEAATTNATVTTAKGTALAATTGIVVKAAAANAASGSNLGSIGGGATADTTDVLVSGPSGEGAANSAIANGWKVQVPNS